MHYYAGVSRIIGILELVADQNNSLLQYWSDHKAENEWQYETEAPAVANDLNAHIKEQAELFGMFLSDIDLENDLANSPLQEELFQYYGKKKVDTLVKVMQTKKAENMLGFLSEHHAALKTLDGNKITKPLMILKQAVEERTHPNHE